MKKILMIVICLGCAYSVVGFLIKIFLILLRKSMLVMFLLVHLKIKYVFTLFIFGCQVTLGYNIMEVKLSQQI